MRHTLLLFLLLVVPLSGGFHVEFTNTGKCSHNQCPMPPLPVGGVDGDQSFVTANKLSVQSTVDCETQVWQPGFGGAANAAASGLDFDLPADVSVTCQFITVPARWKFPQVTRTVDLLVIRFDDRRDPTTLQPQDKRGVVWLHGGPGGTGTNGHVGLLFGAKYYAGGGVGDFIAFDERGAGFSKPEAIWDFQTWDCDPETEPNGLAGCNRRLWAEFATKGIYPSDYNEHDSARDVQALKLYYGYKEWFVIGNSYGTLLAQHYTRAFPGEATGSILDGTISPDVSGISDEIFGGGFMRKFFLLESACATSQSCLANFGGSFATLDAITEDLADWFDTFEDIETPTDEELLAGTIFQTLAIAQPATELTIIPYLPAFIQLLNELRTATPALADEIKAKAVAVLEAFGVPNPLGQTTIAGKHAMRGAHAWLRKKKAYLVQGVGTPQERDINKIGGGWTDLSRMGIMCGAILGATGRPLRLEEYQMFAPLCTGIHKQDFELLEPYDNNLYVDLTPTLIITGLWDAQTVPAQATQVIRVHPLSTNVLLNNAGHCGWPEHPCANFLANNFFKDPLQAVVDPSRGCLATTFVEFANGFSDIIGTGPFFID